MIGRERALEKALMPVRADYDYILIDTPPSLGLLTVNALTAANGVIVPVQCEYLSLRGLVQLEATLQTIRENLNPDVRIRGILPTMLDIRLLHATRGARAAGAELRRPGLPHAGPEDREVGRGPGCGEVGDGVRPDGRRRRRLPGACGGGAERCRRSGLACTRGRWPTSSARPTRRVRPPAARARRPPVPRRQPTTTRAPEPRAPTTESAPPAAPAQPADEETMAVIEPTAAPEPVQAELLAPARPSPVAARPDTAAYLAIIRVVGVGGAGVNAVNRMVEADIRDVEFVAINTDAQQLAGADAERHDRDRLGHHVGPRLGRRPGDRPPRRRGRRTTASARPCAARTSSSSPPARAAAPAPARRPSWRASPASSAR